MHNKLSVFYERRRVYKEKQGGKDETSKIRGDEGMIKKEMEKYLTTRKL